MRARIEELFKALDTENTGLLTGPEVHKISEQMTKEVTGQDELNEQSW